MSKNIKRDKLEFYVLYKNPTCFNKEIPFKIFKYIVDNWQLFYKSFNSKSLYSNKKKKNITLPGTERLSNHWNLYLNDGKKHFITNFPVKNNTHYTIAKYNFNKKIYEVIYSLPKNQLDFPYCEKYFKRNGKRIFCTNNNDIVKLNDVIEENRKLKELIDNGLIYAFINYRFGGNYEGRVIKIKRNLLKILYNNDEISFKFSDYHKSKVFLKNLYTGKKINKPYQKFK